MSANKPIILGEIPKLAIKMQPIGNYNLSNIDWEVEFYVSIRHVVIPKSECEKIDNDTYSARVDTSMLSTGTLRGILYPHIPDPEVESGIYIPPVPFETCEVIVNKYGKSNGMCNN